MNDDPNHHAAGVDNPPTGSGYPPPVPNTSLLPGAEKAPPPGVDLLKRTVQGAHKTIDRLAEGAAPTVRQLGESASDAEAAWHEKSRQLRQSRDDWAGQLRGTVRRKPLASVAVAVALGALIARVIR